MSGLEGLGIACNVMAVITFALDTVKLCKGILDTGNADPDLNENAKNTRQTSDILQTMLSQQRPKPTEAEARLRALAANCVECAKDVEKVVTDISPQKGGVFAAMKSTVKTMRRKSRLEKVKARLETSKTAMDSAVIVQILDECIESGELHRAAYESLSQEQKTLVATYERRSRAIEDLIRQVPDHVTAEHVETRQVLAEQADVFETRNHEKQAYEKLLESLKYPGMDERKNSVPKRHVKTLKWIFEDIESDSIHSDSIHSDDVHSNAESMISSTDSLHRIWQGTVTEDSKRARREADLAGWLQRDDRRLYWISGKPGSGKSTLMKFIATDERTENALRGWNPRCMIISHFIWKPGTPLQQSLHGLLCSLLHQVLSEDTHLAYQFLRDNPTLQMKREVSDWDIDDSEKLLFQAIRTSPRAHLILLDGLDELSKPHGGMSTLFYLLEKLAAEDRVKVCVSSRPERVFVDRFGSSPMLRMQDFTFGDIFHYTTDVLGSINVRSEDGLLRKIAEEISWKAEGVFIWVYVVLQNVKAGIEEFNETWEDIYDRIIELPPDLMTLYKDMWSRLGGNNKKYIKQAARYFQMARHAGEMNECNITTLSVTEDETLETFTKSDKILPVQKLIAMCENTFRTLLPVSAGLLQVRKIRELNYLTEFPDDNWRVIEWDSMVVEFMHRTTLDFLDSNEGRDLFGEYMLGPGDLLSVFVKGELVLRSATGYDARPLQRIWLMMEDHLDSEDGCVKQMINDLLPLIHRHAIDKTRDLLLLSYCKGVSLQNKFLFEATFYRFYDYVEDWLKSTGTYDGLDATYVLLGACNDRYQRRGRSDIELRNKRFLLIRGLLQKHARVGEDKSESPAALHVSDNIMLAWRCFLLHELQRKGGRPFDAQDDRQRVEETLASFIAAGVMDETPQPDYLISVAYYGISMVHSRGDNGGALYCSIIYAEVNDAFLLRTLLGAPLVLPEVVPGPGATPFMRPVLGANNRLKGQEDNFFRLSHDGRDQEALETWMFGDFVDPEKDGGVQDMFPDKTPDFLEAVDIGKFSSDLDALKEIGYELPEVNLGYVCAHYWWM
ncbi:hypothetical protein CkaCkLH20_03971 [Colletotrichum karsti]|uniref:NACHT domain-containing protein n=1 Tax=Colletotrichum karsti TaxID=1095194 RepID=A0A9P6I923_9PEZI|nr:uncharacterized protein CkaCkLH20_03971 [Colletotrichum karsti]KAF9878479.1 hypothetical protein CkaCkLH20_03971 [Colletotrichum karsti]